MFKVTQQNEEDFKKQVQLNSHYELEEDYENVSTTPNSICNNCLKFEVLMRKLIKENEKLMYENNYKEISLKKREELMNHYANENQELKNKIQNLNNKINKLEMQLECKNTDYTARSFFSKNSQKILRAASLNTVQQIEKCQDNKNKQYEQKKTNDDNKQYKNINGKNDEQNLGPSLNMQDQYYNSFNEGYEQHKQRVKNNKQNDYNHSDNNQNEQKQKDNKLSNTQENDKYIKKSTFSKYSTKSIYNISIPQTSSKTVVDNSKGYPKVIKSQSESKQNGQNNIDTSGFYNKEKDMIYNYDKYESFVQATKQDEKKLPYQQQQQDILYKNYQIKIKKKQRSCQSVTGIYQRTQPQNYDDSSFLQQNQNKIVSYIPTKFVERDQVQREQEAKVLIKKMSQTNLQVVEESNDEQNNQNIKINSNEDKEQNDVKIRIRSITTLENKSQTPIEINENNNEKAGPEINKKARDLSPDKNNRCKSASEMNDQQKSSSITNSQTLYHNNNVLTPPTNRSSFQQGKNQNILQPSKSQFKNSKSMYSVIESLQNDQYQQLNEDTIKCQDNEKVINFTQAISRQQTINSPQAIRANSPQSGRQNSSQSGRQNSSGSNRNNKPNTNLLNSSSSQNINSSPNKMLTSQRNQKRVSKRYQYRKLEDVENQIMLLTKEQDLKKAKDNPRNFWIWDFVEEPQQFFYKMSQQPAEQQVSFADSIQKLLTDYVISLDFSLMLKKSLESCIEVSKSLRFNDILKNLHEQLIKNINCQKIFFYIFDEKTKEFWSTKPDNSTIRIKPHRGLLKHLVTTLETIKVEDIAFDPRFDPSIDSLLHPDIKSLLLIPLLSNQNTLLGVVQIVNLNYKSNAKYAYDQMKVENIVRVSGNIISLGMIYEQNFLNNQRIMKLLTILYLDKLQYIFILNKIKNNINLFQSESIDELMSEGQQSLADIFGTQKCIMYIINENNMLQRFKKIYFKNQQEKNKNLNQNNNNNKKNYNIISDQFELNTGIIGLSIKNKNELEVYDPQIHPYFNPLTDLDTYLPTYTLPIMYNQKVVGALQVAYLNTQLGKKVLSMDILYREIIQHFGNLIGHCFDKLQRYNQDLQEKMQDEKQKYKQELDQLKDKLSKQAQPPNQSIVSPVQISKKTRGPVYNNQLKEINVPIQQRSCQQFLNESDGSIQALNPLPNSLPNIQQNTSIQLQQQNKQEQQLNDILNEFQQNKQKTQQIQQQTKYQSKIPIKQNSISQQSLNQYQKNQQNTKQKEIDQQKDNSINNNSQKTEIKQKNNLQDYSNDYIQSRSQHSKINPKTQNEGLSQVLEENNEVQY